MVAGRAAGDWIRSFPQGLWLAGDEGADVRAAFVRKALGLAKGSRVLDAPCGAGRIAIHLARAGCVVTGLDRSAAFIARCRKRFRAEGLAGRFVAGDLREMEFDGGFDAALNWGGSFGYFSDAENADVVRRYARALAPGGRLLIDQPNREYVLRHFHAMMTQKGIAVRCRWRPDVERVDTRWRVTRRGRERRSLSSIRLYTAGQFRGLLEAAGMKVEALYGGLDGGRFRRISRRIYVVGRKP